MLRTVIWSLGLCLLITICGSPVHAQTCTTAVCTATSTSQSAVLAALPAPGNTNPTVVVNLQGVTGTWTGVINYTIPSAVTNLTIQGQTTVNCTGTAGTSTYACTATDNTVIVDSYSGGQPDNNPILTINTGAASTLFRMTGITFQGGNAGTNPKAGGTIIISGNSQNVRIDHNHFNDTTYSPQILGSWIRIYGPLEGVADHNVFDLGLNNTYNWINGGIEFDNNIGDTVGHGDGMFNLASGWGTSAFFFMENNVFNGGVSDDCAVGGTGKFVERYSSFHGLALPVQSHGTKTDNAGSRGCRAVEIYHNYWDIGPNSSNEDTAMSFKGSTALVWGNTVASGYNHFLVLNADRNGTTGDEKASPNGWGTCGASTPQGNGSPGPTNWDGNQTAFGYPCLDGIGRGQTLQSLNGAPFATRVNSATGTIAWPQQYLEPIYSFDNALTISAMWYTLDHTTTANRDFYFDCGTYNSACSSGFTGAVGTGFGLLASRPSTCTAGPGGTYGRSPTGSYGVAYFATDQNTLYVCTATNTWTAVYTPYTYPHPLIAGGTAGTPDAPTGLVVTVQ